MSDAELLEQLAALEHERWSDWQRYFHSKCEPDAYGNLVIPASYVAALEELIATPYAALREDQKENDRREVRRYWPLFCEVRKQDRRIVAAARKLPEITVKNPLIGHGIALAIIACGLRDALEGRP